MQPAPTIKTDDDWQTEATQSAIAAAQRVIAEGAINGRTIVSSLSEIEWGWIVCAAIFGWIETKARQAVDEGHSVDVTIRTMSHRSPEPWEAGAIAAILPDLGGIEGLDWDKPVSEWSKDQIVTFAWSIHRMSNAALMARDEGATDKIVRFLRAQQEREVSAANGGPLMAHDEGDEIPF